jgi:hypothetical protein
VPGQDEEGRLESVLGVLFMVQHAPAHAGHQRAVAGDEFREGVLVAPGGEVAEPLPVQCAERRRGHVL